MPATSPQRTAIGMQNSTSSSSQISKQSQPTQQNMKQQDLFPTHPSSSPTVQGTMSDSSSSLASTTVTTPATMQRFTSSSSTALLGNGGNGTSSVGGTSSASPPLSVSQHQQLNNNPPYTFPASSTVPAAASSKSMSVISPTIPGATTSHSHALVADLHTNHVDDLMVRLAQATQWISQPSTAGGGASAGNGGGVGVGGKQTPNHAAMMASNTQPLLAGPSGSTAGMLHPSARDGANNSESTAVFAQYNLGATASRPSRSGSRRSDRKTNSSSGATDRKKENSPTPVTNSSRRSGNSGAGSSVAVPPVPQPQPQVLNPNPSNGPVLFNPLRSSPNPPLLSSVDVAAIEMVNMNNTNNNGGILGGGSGEHHRLLTSTHGSGGSGGGGGGGFGTGSSPRYVYETEPSSPDSSASNFEHFYCGFIPKSWRREFIAPLICAALMVGVGILVAILIYRSLHQAELTSFNDKLAISCQQRAKLLQQNFGFATAACASMRGFFSVQMRYQREYNILWPRSDWYLYIEQANTPEFVDQFVFMPRVLDSERAGFEALTGHNITDIDVCPSKILKGNTTVCSPPDYQHRRSTFPVYYPYHYKYPNFTGLPPGIDDLFNIDGNYALPLQGVDALLIPNTVGSGILRFSNRQGLRSDPTDTTGEYLTRPSYGIVAALPFYDSGSTLVHTGNLSSDYLSNLPHNVGIVAGVIRAGVALKGAVNALEVLELQHTLTDTETYEFITEVYHPNAHDDLLDLSQNVSVPFNYGERNYRLDCVPSQDYVQTAYSGTPLLIGVGAGIVVGVAIMIIICGFLILNVRRTNQRATMLQEANDGKNAALALLAQAKELADRANKSKSDFLAFLCHELRNPLHAISAMVDFLHQDYFATAVERNTVGLGGFGTTQSNAQQTSSGRGSPAGGAIGSGNGAERSPRDQQDSPSMSEEDKKLRVIGGGLMMADRKSYSDNQSNPIPSHHPGGGATMQHFSNNPNDLNGGTNTSSQSGTRLTNSHQRRRIRDTGRAEAADCVSVIRSQVDLMRTIIDDCLDMSKIESGVISFESIGIELAVLARQCIQSLNSKCKDKGIRLRLRIDQTNLPRKVYADPTRLKQLIMNLLTNAIKFTSSGGVQLVLAATPWSVEAAMAAELEIPQEELAAGKTATGGVAATNSKGEATNNHTRTALGGGSIVASKQSGTVAHAADDVTKELNAAQGPQIVIHNMTEDINLAHTSATPARPSLPEKLLSSPAAASSGPQRPSMEGNEPGARLPGTSPKAGGSGDGSPAVGSGSSGDKKSGNGGAGALSDEDDSFLPNLPPPLISPEAVLLKPQKPSKIILQVSVADSGSGIDPSALPHLFQPYSQEKLSIMRTHGGTGLGLAIVKNIVSHMHGSIQVQSEVGKGSKFTLFLPLDCRAPNSEVNENELENEATSTMLRLKALRAEKEDEEEEEEDCIESHLLDKFDRSEEAGLPSSDSDSTGGGLGNGPTPRNPTPKLRGKRPQPQQWPAAPPLHSNPSTYVNNSSGIQPRVSPRHVSERERDRNNRQLAATGLATVAASNSQEATPDASRRASGSHSGGISHNGVNVVFHEENSLSSKSSRSSKSRKQFKPAVVSSSESGVPVPPLNTAAINSTTSTKREGEESPMLKSSFTTQQSSVMPSSTLLSPPTQEFSTNHLNAAVIAGSSASSGSHSYSTPNTATTSSRRIGSSSSSSSEQPLLRVLLIDDADINLKILVKMLGTHLAHQGVQYKLVLTLSTNGAEAMNEVEKYYAQAMAVREQLLSEQAVNASTATTTTAAQSNLALPPLQYDIIASDIVMPILDGFGFAKSLRVFETQHSLPSAPLIALTANALKADVDAYQQASFSGFIPKPFRRADLQAAFQTVLTARSPTSQQQQSGIRQTPSTMTRALQKHVDANQMGDSPQVA